MKAKEIMNSASRSLTKAGFQIKKHSPEILVVVGAVGTVASAVMACKSTLKACDILEETHDQLDAINQVVEMNREDYTEQDHKKDVAIVYAQTAVKFVKLYAPSVILGAASISCMVASNNILRKRNVALAAAYATVDKGFKEYRKNVVDRFGEDLDKELRFGIKAKEFETVTTDKKGNEKVEKEVVSVADEAAISYSGYARIFDDGCKGWTKDPESNLYFLNKQCDWANDKLKADGYLFLNDVYEMLGIPKTKAGQVVGWVYDDKNPIGDNYVDFGIYNTNIERARAFVNGYEATIVLDFNVDGNILDLI